MSHPFPVVVSLPRALLWQGRYLFAVGGITALALEVHSKLA